MDDDQNTLAGNTSCLLTWLFGVLFNGPHENMARLDKGGTTSMRFFVAGVPVPKGSAKAFVVKGRAVVTQDNGEKQKPWASSISWLAQQSMNGNPLMLGPVIITLVFIMPRPKAHYGTGRNSASIKENAPYWHTAKPDLDKLIRCVKDALTGVVYKDDSQVVQLDRCTKSYGPTPGVTIMVTDIHAQAVRGHQ